MNFVILVALVFATSQSFLVFSHLPGKATVDELLKQRDDIHAAFTTTKSVSLSSGSGHFSNGSSNKFLADDYKSESPGDKGSSDSKGKTLKNKCFNLNLKGSDKKL